MSTTLKSRINTILKKAPAAGLTVREIADKLNAQNAKKGLQPTTYSSVRARVYEMEGTSGAVRVLAPFGSPDPRPARFYA